MKITFAIAVLIYGVAAINLRRGGDKGGDDHPEIPEELRAPMKCAIEKIKAAE